MGATNHTTNYNLPQFVGSDKPTWLGDINGAMSAIDTQMKANDTLANTAKSTADTASTTAGTALTNAATADGKAVDAQTTATSALNKALANEATLNSMFNFTDIMNVTTSDLTLDGVVVNSIPLTIAKNADESLFKIYGAIAIGSFTKTGAVSVTINNVFNNVPASYNIDSAGLVLWSDGGNRRIKITLNTNGSITLELNTSTTNGCTAYLFPCLYINQDFGDE